MECLATEEHYGCCLAIPRWDCKIQGINQRIDVTIPIKRVILRSEEVDKDLYTAIDKVTDKLERQIRKNKTRLARQNEINYPSFNMDFPEEEDNNEGIVKRKKLETKPMDEEEAILEMNLLGHDFFVYEDMNTNKICVIYKRKDGNYGLIETK